MRIVTLLLVLLLAPATVLAQTTYRGLLYPSFQTDLSVASNAVGSFTATYDDGTNELTVNGRYAQTTSSVTTSHVHDGAFGEAGPVIFALNNDGGVAGTFSGTGTLTPAQETDLYEGKLYVNVHTESNPNGEIRSQIVQAPALNGDLSDPEWVQIATKLNNNQSFGANRDVQAIYYYPDAINRVLYVGVAVDLPSSNNDGLGLWLDLSSINGAPAGTPLGFPSAGHYMNGDSDGVDDNFVADFEVDFMFSLHTGATTNDVFLNSAQILAGSGGGLDRSSDYIGQANQSGAIAYGPRDNTDDAGGAPLASRNAIRFAYLADTGGFEFAVPYAELAALPSDDVRAFAFIVSAAGYFSNVTVPGNVTGGEPGFNANFNTMSGGPYHSSFEPLPVELTAFHAELDGAAALLTWATATEEANAGFHVEHAAPSAAFQDRGFVSGAGTTTEAQRYAFTAEGLAPGTHRFRLRQVDHDGTATLSPEVEVVVGQAQALTLQAGPNPFAQRAEVRFSVADGQNVRAELFDVLGRRVATLYDGAASAGELVRAEVEGAELPAGLYLVRLTTERGLSRTATLTLIR